MATFVKAADLGSFAAAAADLGISPQLVAKRIGFLEDRLNARLLARSTRRQTVTEIGNLYRERCRAVLADVEAADELAETAAGIPRGRLRVSAPLTFGSRRMAPMVTDYLRAHREVAIDLELSDRYVDLLEGRFEVVFRIGALADSSLKARALAPFRLVACASPTYLSAHTAPRIPQDLARHQCLLYARRGDVATRTWHFAREGTTHEVKVEGRLTVDSAAALLHATLHSFGIAILAEDLAADALAAGDLVAVLPGFEPPARAMHMIFLPDRPQTPKLRSFIDAAAAAFA